MNSLISVLPFIVKAMLATTSTSNKIRSPVIYYCLSQDTNYSIPASMMPSISITFTAIAMLHYVLSLLQDPSLIYSHFAAQMQPYSALQETTGQQHFLCTFKMKMWNICHNIFFHHHHFVDNVSTSFDPSDQNREFIFLVPLSLLILCKDCAY